MTFICCHIQHVFPWLSLTSCVWHIGQSFISFLCLECLEFCGEWDGFHPNRCWYTPQLCKGWEAKNFISMASLHQDIGRSSQPTVIHFLLIGCCCAWLEGRCVTGHFCRLFCVRSQDHRGWESVSGVLVTWVCHCSPRTEAMLFNLTESAVLRERYQGWRKT